MSKTIRSDEYFMKLALKLAHKGAGAVSPNPMVGAVVIKNGKIIGKGYHKVYGGPHAEVEALKKLSKKQISGATVYVTLEPCSHFGKTPPCANFLIKNGIKSVCIGMKDPNPQVNGKGIQLLKKAGIKVQTGILEEEAQSLNKVFIKNKTRELPYITVKFGVTLDGKIATQRGESKYITSNASREYVHKLRSQVDAMLTSSTTVKLDNPHLGIRLNSSKKVNDPIRIILDRTLQTSLNSQVYRDQNVIVATTNQSSDGNLAQFQKKGLQVLVYEGKDIPLKTLFNDLYKKGIYHVMVEAGSGVATSLFKEKLADELIIFFAPKILGDGIPFVQDLGIRALTKAIQLKNVEHKSFGDDMMMRGEIVYENPESEIMKI